MSVHQDGVVDRIVPPWTASLTVEQHDLILFAMAAAALALLATLVRSRFSPVEAHGSFRSASLTANAVVAIAFVSYLAVIAAFLTGYQQQGQAWVPMPGAHLAWAMRYVDWIVTVPLLVVEVIAISTLTGPLAHWVRRIGIGAAIAMVLCGFLGAFTINGGTDPTSYVLLGVAAAACFTVLYGLILFSVARSFPRLPRAVQGPYRAAMLVLLPTWFAYPVVYGLAGIPAAATVAVVGQIVLSIADIVAKVGFGTLVHRVSVLRSRAQEDLDPTAVRRPRTPLNDSVWVEDDDLLPLERS